MTGKILQSSPQHPQPLDNYPVWNSVQKFINAVTLCGTLTSPDFRKTFHQRNVEDAVVTAFLQRVASDAVSIIHSVHVGGGKNALEAIPDSANGKAQKKNSMTLTEIFTRTDPSTFFVPFILAAIKSTTKILRSFQTDNIKSVEIGYGIRRLDNRPTSAFPLVSLGILNQIISKSELENDRYIHLTKWSNDEQPASLSRNKIISGRYLFIFAQSQAVIETPLGNPIIANLIDKNYYTGPHAIAREMCKVEKTYPSIRSIAPYLFVWDTELPENAFWWSTMAVCQHYYLHQYH
jgi:hypothetical protein